VSKAITKKLSKILYGDSTLRVYAIKRQKPARCILAYSSELEDYDMRWYGSPWNAWSHRPATGVYQQIIIFVPEVDAE
jgi:hypothetical protein